MPAKLTRRRSGGPEARAYTSFWLDLATISPVHGGGSKAGRIDAFDPVRGPTVRGHLRFWWRAACGHLIKSPEELARREAELFGKAAGDEGGRSALEIRISDVELPEDREFSLTKKPQEVPGGQGHRGPHGRRAAAKDESPGIKYAFWTIGLGDKATTQLLPPGLKFRLTITCPEAHEGDLRAAVRAWVYFGGYGGRTRRGAGSLTVTGSGPNEEDQWLPTDATPEALLGFLPEAPASESAVEDREANDMPVLDGAVVAVGSEGRDALKAFDAAAGWLGSFRQGSGDPKGESSERHAREAAPDDDPRRPGQSRWPEADKVRQLSDGEWSHAPRYGGQPAWPRAGFGLPIIGQFQRRARDGSRLKEPDNFELRWCQGDETRDRLASPLIVKTLALADKRFVPLALWFSRAFPSGEVILHKHPNEADSAAPFDRLVGDGDEPLFGPLELGLEAEAGQRLQTAFFYWLEDTRKAKVVSP